MRKKASVEGSGVLGQSPSRVLTKMSLASSRAQSSSEIKTSQELLEEERFRKLKEAKKNVTRDVLIEHFQLDLSPYFAAKFFDVLGINGEVDIEGFRKVLRVVESPILLDRQKVVFAMFDPNSQGRISKNDFRKTVAELLNGATKQFPVATQNLNKDATFRIIPQAITDFVFQMYCEDDQRGMELKEWLDYAMEDIDVSRLIFALDKRIIWNETLIRRRFLA